MENVAWLAEKTLRVIEYFPEHKAAKFKQQGGERSMVIVCFRPFHELIHSFTEGIRVKFYI